MDKKYLEKQILRSLQPLNLEKVILFGSYARNTMREDSDVDLYIVSKEDFTPATFAENMQHHKKYTRALKELKKILPMDILVHTRPMNRMFEESKSAFAREILEHGERLL